MTKIKLPSIEEIQYIDGFPKVALQESTQEGIRSGKVSMDRDHIVCLGCSNTYGYELKEDDSWPAMLQKMIQDNFQVLNMGRMGYGLRLLIDWYHKYANGLNVRAVILQLPHFSRQPFPGIQKDERIHYTAFYGSIYVTDFADDLGVEMKGIRRLIPRSAFLGITDVLIANEVERFRAFTNYLQSRGIEVAVISYLVPYWSVMKSDVVKYFKAVRRVSEDREIKILDDITDLFMRTSGMTMDFTHPNKKGNEYIAKQIYQKMFNQTAALVGSDKEVFR